MRRGQEKSMSTIFVAGAAGIIGTALLASLHGASADVVAGVHTPAQAATLKELGVEARVFDYGDQASMTAAMQGCDRMFMVLPLAEGMTRWGHLAVEAAKAAGIGYIVRSSGYAASSDAHWRLGREHGMVDQFVEDSGIPFTILRPNTFMQAFSTVLADSVRAGVLTQPEGDAKVSYIDVRDVADCAARLLLDSAGHEKHFYALTGPQGLTMAEVTGQLSSASGREVRYEPAEEEVYVQGLARAGVPEWNINMLVSLTRVVKLGMAGNVTKAVEYLTGVPARTFADFAAEHGDCWR
jgi:Predicted nucleoside-diphosphate-sugar epimerases